jgi:hypothetical protein
MATQGMQRFGTLLAILVALVFLSTCPLPPDAQRMTVSEYHEGKALLEKGRNDPTYSQAVAFFNLYIKGIGDGFVWFNTLLQTTKRDPLYCTPEKLGINAQNYQQVLESYLPTLNAKAHWPMGTWKSVEDVSVGFVLLEALMDGFPCNTESSDGESQT